MNPTLKKTLAVLLAGVMLLSFAACKDKPADSTGTQGTQGTQAAPAAPAADRDAAAAKLGNLTITVGDVEDIYNQMIAMYSAYGMPAPTADGDIDSLQDAALAELIGQKMLLYQAQQQGYDTLTDEQEAELAEEVSAHAEEIISLYSQDAEVEGTGEDVRSAAIELINKDLAANGWDVDFEGYCAEYEEGARERYIAKNLEDAIKSTVVVEEGDVKSYYDALYAEQQATLEDPTQYLAGEEAYEMDGGKPMLMVPEGFVRVKALTVMPTGNIAEGYDALLTEMGELEAEFGRLSLTGEGSNARLAEIKTDYAAKKLEADKLFEDYTAPARAKIQEAYQKLKAGTAFNEVFAAYNEDTSYTTYDAFANRGRLMMPGQDDGAWDDALRTAAAGLKAGEYSEIVEIEGGYYIVYLVGPETPGDVAYETVHDALQTLALERKQETAWNDQRQAWAGDDSLVTRFEDAYRSIGK